MGGFSAAARSGGVCSTSYATAESGRALQARPPRRLHQRRLAAAVVAAGAAAAAVVPRSAHAQGPLAPQQLGWLPAPAQQQQQQQQPEQRQRPGRQHGPVSCRSFGGNLGENLRKLTGGSKPPANVSQDGDDAGEAQQPSVWSDWQGEGRGARVRARACACGSCLGQHACPPRAATGRRHRCACPCLNINAPTASCMAAFGIHSCTCRSPPSKFAHVFPCRLPSCCAAELSDQDWEEWEGVNIADLDDISEVRRAQRVQHAQCTRWQAQHAQRSQRGSPPAVRSQTCRSTVDTYSSPLAVDRWRS